MTYLSPHFTLEELTRSSYAVRHGIDNTAPAGLLENGILLAAGLERVRAVLSLPLHVDSGYRSPKANAGVGGSRDSAHLDFLAADIVCQTFGTPREIACALVPQALMIGFDKLILEGDWVHIAFADEPRYEVLTAHFGSGKATYTKGLS